MTNTVRLAIKVQYRDFPDAEKPLTRHPHDGMRLRYNC